MAKKKISANIAPVMTVDVLNKARKDQFFQKEVMIPVNGIDYIVLVDNKFETNKLQELFKELFEKQSQLSEIKDALSMSEYLLFLTIKYFTNLEACQGEKTLAEQMHVFGIMLDLDIVKQILESIDQTEIAKMSEFMETISKNVEEIKKNPKLVTDYETIINGMVEKEILEREKAMLPKGKYDDVIVKE